MDLSGFTEFLLVAPILLFSLVAHEYAHGWVAYRNGDTTAWQLGRLTWNPIKHIDPFLTILLPLLFWLSHAPILGGAKPVPVNPRNYRNFRKGDILVSLAGITANIIIGAFLCPLVVVLLYFLARGVPSLTQGAAIMQKMFLYGIGLNFVLAMFNLLPIPPLDGSHVMKYILPPSWALAYARLSRFGLIIVYLLIVLGGTFFLFWLSPAFMASDRLQDLLAPYLLPWPRAIA